VFYFTQRIIELMCKIWYSFFVQEIVQLIKTTNQNKYMNQFILIVNGPVCSGKTSTVTAIMGKYKKVFNLQQNKIKWLISDYTPDRDRKAVQESLLLVGERMLENGMSLILEGGSVTQGEMNKALETIGEKHGIKTTYVNIEAPLDVLKERFQERLKVSQERGTKLSFTDDEGYMKRYNAYTAIKGDAPTFDTSILLPDEVSEKIMALV
jgi:predicted kinase